MKHSDKWQLVLALDDEEAMCLDRTLDTGVRTARVQVNVSFLDQNGTRWSASRVVAMRVKREQP